MGDEIGSVSSMVADYKSTADYRKFVTEQIESERKVVESLGLNKKAN